MYTPRASRVPLDAPVRYRVANHEEWFQSQVVNVSESGVLFGPTDLMEGTHIELILSIPRTIDTLPAGQLFCVGEVVRTTDTGAAAAVFHERRFLLEV
jgi:hypothetical protein